jgi:hypothetical protein
MILAPLRITRVAVFTASLWGFSASGQDLSLSQAGPGSVQTSSNGTFTLTVTGGGATNVTLTNVLPSSFTFVSATPPAGGSCSNNCGTVTCTLPTFSGSAVFTVVATATTAGTFANVAGVVADGYDSNAANNTSTSTATVTQASAPTISSLSQTAGGLSGGAGVTINGSNFRTIPGKPTVAFGGAAATVGAVTASTIAVTTPAHGAGPVNVVVTNADGTNATLSNGFTYVSPPTVTVISPSAGPIGGGAAVTVSGTGFATGLILKLGGTQASYGSFTSTSISATTPAHAVGIVDVTVTDSYGQTGTLAGGFTYLNAPGVTSVSPGAGPSAGGGTYTVYGTNFSTPTVIIGGNSVTPNSWTTTSAVFTLPAHVVGVVDVTVKNIDSQQWTLSGAFTYVDPPTISTVTPSAGPVNVGTAVTISGTNLVAGSTVTFGGSAATSVNPQGTTLACVTPLLGAGSVNVVVTAPGGSATKTAGYTYMSPPTLTTLSSSTGPASGGQSVTVTGSNFVSGMGVSFGGLAGTVTSVPDSAHAVVTTPAHTAGTFNVVVTTLGGSATLANSYTFVGQPTISSLAPSSASTAGGDLITILGTNFYASTLVSVDGNSASQLTVVSATQMTFRTASHAPGPVSVVVSNPGVGSASSTFTYLAAATKLYTITPCRILDTRNPVGPLGGPSLAAGETRVFTVTGACGIPTTARTVSANYTVAAPASAGSISILPGGDPATPATSMSFNAGATRANNGFMTLSWSGDGTISVTNNSAAPTDFVIDANGYFQ